MNILKADFFHLRKDKLFLTLLIITFVLPMLSCLMPVLFGTNASTLESIVFQGLSTDILCVLIGIQLSSFIGKDYSNNTIRNKVCYGEKRTKIVLAYFFETLLISLIFIAVSLISSFIFGSIFGKISFSADFVPKLFCQMLLLISFAFVITCLVISTKSAKAGFIFTILISVLLNAVGYLLPILAATNQIASILCRVLYMITSSMLLKSTNGIYTYGETIFGGLYLNSILIFVVYLTISIVVSLLITKKQEYK